MKGSQTFAFFVEYWVMMKSTALVLKTGLNAADNMGIGSVQTMEPGEAWRNKKLRAVVGMKNEWRRTMVIGFIR